MFAKPVLFSIIPITIYSELLKIGYEDNDNRWFGFCW